MRSYLLFAVLAAVMSGPLFGQFTTYTFTGTGTGAIPDGTSVTPPAFGAPRTISFNVSGLPYNVRNVTITLNISHTWVGDVEVALYAPGGSPNGIIFSRTGATTTTSQGDDSDLNGTYTFYDISTHDFWATAASAGPTTALQATDYRASLPGGSATGGTIVNIDPVFAGLTPGQANGTWTLVVRDCCLGDTGTVSAATLGIVTGPTITNINPSVGNISGGTSVTITGENFDPGTTVVTFDGITASASVTPTQITCTTPPHAVGFADVTVTTAYGSYTLLGGYFYTSASGGGGDGGGGDGGCSTTDQPASWLAIIGTCIALAVAGRPVHRQFRAFLGQYAR